MDTQEGMPCPAHPVWAGRLRGIWPVAGWLLVFVLLSGALQWYIPYPWDADTAYHAAVGGLIRQHGILHAFPWTPFSWLADHYFYEKDPELYRLWYRLPKEAPADSADIIKRRFGARYAICLDKPGRRQFFYRLSATPGVRTLLVTDLWMVYDLGGAPP